MAVPEGFAPYVTNARRYYWLRQQARDREGDDGASATWRAVRLATPGTALWRQVPGRTQLLAYGVLALEEVLGAGVDELRAYGLRRATAEALITFCERVAANMTTFSGGPNLGQLYDQDAVILLASATKAASYTTDTYELGDRGTLRLDLDVTAISGPGARLHVQVETRKDSADSWRVVDAFVAVTAVGAQRRAVGPCDRYIRAVCTLDGTTPSVTFSLIGEGV